MTQARPDDPAFVRRQYAAEDHLETRRGAWRPDPDGRDAVTLVREAVVAEDPATVLDVGCGTGAFAEQLAAALPNAPVGAADASPRMVALAAARGIPAVVAGADELPYPDHSFDVVSALWMLYHVPDVDAALAEFGRVLTPGGLLVVATNGDGHVADLRRQGGGAPLVTAFSSENGEAALRRRFADVTREDLAPRAFFADHAAALAYLRSSQEPVDWDLPYFTGPREYAGAVTLFCARRDSPPGRDPNETSSG